MEMISLLLSGISLVVLILLWIRSSKSDHGLIIEKTRELLQNELRENRSELNQALKDNRLQRI
jgi:hypothetical protein